MTSYCCHTLSEKKEKNIFQPTKPKAHECPQYPGWFNFPVDVVVGGAGQDQVENQSQKKKKINQLTLWTRWWEGPAKIRYKSTENVLLVAKMDVGINSNNKRQELDFLVISGIKLNFIATILCVQVLITAIGAMGDDTMLRWVTFIA